LCLSVKARNRELRVPQVLAQDLERYRLPEKHVLRAIHRAHRADAEQAGKLVPIGVERRWVRRWARWRTPGPLVGHRGSTRGLLAPFSLRGLAPLGWRGRLLARKRRRPLALRRFVGARLTGHSCA